MVTPGQNTPSILHTKNGVAYEYRYRTLSITHLGELQEDIEHLRSAGLINDAPTFQMYMQTLAFALPEKFTTAKSILIMAIALPPLTINFHHQNARIPALIPPNYYEPDLTRTLLYNEIQQQIIQEQGYHIERIETYHLKLLAARSGLARYGRNNISYVDGMGSFFTLHAFLTDYPFETDHWQEIKKMDLCEKCRICLTHCPTQAIREEEFVIHVNRCLPLYNEIPGEIPAWIPTNMHHTVIGCMKCQAPCPANHLPMQKTQQLEDMTEAETQQLLDGNPDTETMIAIAQKLRIPYLAEESMVEVAVRNVRALIAASQI